MFRLLAMIVAMMMCSASAYAQIWIWMNGGDQVNQLGIYGTKGIANSANTPGAREEAISWTADDGRLYLFGGWGYDNGGNLGYLNDLWQYDTASGYWTWISGSSGRNPAGAYGTKGSPSVSNYPGGRKSGVAWYGGNGYVYLFGGEGRDAAGASGRLNDLWRFTISTGEWTWLSGSDSVNHVGRYFVKGVANAVTVPGARRASVGWNSQSGKLYLFGGSGRDTSGAIGWMNDLWVFDIASNQWKWLSGSKMIDESGSYGVRGTPSAANVPGAREGASGAAVGGSYYLFGGFGRDETGYGAYMNDLWLYDTLTGYWTWLSGSELSPQFPVYGRKGLETGSNVPGCRLECAGLYPGDSCLYIFGGPSADAIGNYGSFNDLWRYNLRTGNWTWLSGLETPYQFGNYLVRTKRAIQNIPGARSAPSAWTFGDSALYIFGGYGYMSNGSDGRLNDLWKIHINTSAAHDTLWAGWQLVSPPLVQFDMTARGLYGDDMPFPPSMYAYSGGAYSSTDTLISGRGYWAYQSANAAVDAAGSSPDTAAIPLTSGWNLTGNPFDIPCVIPTMIRFVRGAETKTLAEASMAGWFSTGFFGFNGSAYTLAASSLEVWNGYWINAALPGITMLFSRTPF